MHYELNPRSKLNSFQGIENYFPKSLNLTIVSTSCRVHRNSDVKSLDPCSLIFQMLSQPTVLKIKSNSMSIPVAWRRVGSYTDGCMNLLVNNSLEASFSRLFHNLRCFSSNRRLVADDDAPRTLTCMSALALEEELLVERPDPEWVIFPTNLFNILKKSTEQQKLVELVRK